LKVGFFRYSYFIYIGSVCCNVVHKFRDSHYNETIFERINIHGEIWTDDLQ